MKLPEELERRLSDHCEIAWDVLGVSEEAASIRHMLYAAIDAERNACRLVALNHAGVLLDRKELGDEIGAEECEVVANLESVLVHPVRNDEDHKAALTEIERLWNSESGTRDADRLEVLSILVEAYERNLEK